MLKNKEFNLKARNSDLLLSEIFLNQYSHNKNTHNSYKSMIYRFLIWCANIQNKEILNLKAQDIEDFISFMKTPPKSWVSEETYAKNHPSWRPFSLNLKATGKTTFQISNESIKHTFRILGSFYQYLQQEGKISYNPVLQIRQKNKFLFKNQEAPKIRRLSNLQWKYVLNCLKSRAEKDELKERDLFIASLMYGLYLRTCELTPRFGWEPKMNSFYKDSDEKWWFKVLGKGSKFRDIAVSESVLNALKRYRKSINLNPLPDFRDETPLFLNQKTQGIIINTRAFSRVIKHAFFEASAALIVDGFEGEAEALKKATPHWLRHTGISEDVKVRPREHVRDDAGHSSFMITDKYISIQKSERHQSAQNKALYF